MRPAVMPLVLLAGLALALRLWQLGQPSLWHDEALELERSLASLPRLLAGRPIDQDPPLAALIWRFWILAGGGPGAALATSEWWLRLPSALVGAATAPLAGAWAGRRFGSRAGWLCGLLMAIAPVQVYYGQELNQYAAIPLATLALLIAWEAVLARGRARDWRRLGLVSALALLCHYGMAFPVAATVLHLGWRAWWTPGAVARRRLAGQLAVLATTLLVLLGLGLAERAATPHLDARLFGTGLVKELDYLADTVWRELLVFLSLPFSGGPALWSAGALAILAGFGALTLRAAEAPPPEGLGVGRRILVVGLLAPLALVYPADILGLYPLGYRWALFALPVSALCIALALDRLWCVDAAAGWAATALVALNLLLFLPQQDAWNPWLALPREAMRPALVALAEAARPGDVVYVSDGGWPAFAHYRARLGLSDLPALRGQPPDAFAPEVERRRILDARAPEAAVWLVDARDAGTLPRLEAALRAAGFAIDRVADFPGVRLGVARRAPRASSNAPFKIRRRAFGVPSLRRSVRPRAPAGRTCGVGDRLNADVGRARLHGSSPLHWQGRDGRQDAGAEAIAADRPGEVLTEQHLGRFLAPAPVDREVRHRVRRGRLRPEWVAGDRLNA